MTRWLERAALAVLLFALAFTAADWLVWTMRSRFDAGFGGGFDSVTVTRMVVAPLKGNREEYYADGTEEERCSRSVLPWSGARACWWVRRQRMVMER